MQPVGTVFISLPCSHLKHARLVSQAACITCDALFQSWQVPLFLFLIFVEHNLALTAGLEMASVTKTLAATLIVALTVVANGANKMKGASHRPRHETGRLPRLPASLHLAHHIRNDRSNFVGLSEVVTFLSSCTVS